MDQGPETLDFLKPEDGTLYKKNLIKRHENDLNMSEKLLNHGGVYLCYDHEWYR